MLILICSVILFFTFSIIKGDVCHTQNLVYWEYTVFLFAHLYAMECNRRVVVVQTIIRSKTNLNPCTSPIFRSHNHYITSKIFYNHTESGAKAKLWDNIATLAICDNCDVTSHGPALRFRSALRVVFTHYHHRVRLPKYLFNEIISKIM